MCEVELARLEEQVINIDPLTTIIYGKGTFIRYTCYDLLGDKRSADIEMKGVTRIKAPESQKCMFSAGVHKWHTNPSLEAEVRSRIADTDIKLSSYLSIPPFSVRYLFVQTSTLSKSMLVPNVTYPTDTIIFQPRGIMFPTLKYGHIRTTINITAMQAARDAICDLRTQAYFMINYILNAKNQKEANLTIGWTKTTGDIEINLSVLKAIKREIQRNKRIPTAGFADRVQIYKEELCRACDLAEQDMILIRELFLPRGVTETINHLHSQGSNRPKRQVLVGIGISILTGIFSAAKVFQMSSEVAAVKQNQKYIISVVRRLAQKQEMIIQICKELSVMNKELELKMGAYAFEAKLVSALYAMTRNAKRMTDFIQNMKTGIFKGLAGKLAPDIMDGGALHVAMQTISRIALKQGYYPLTTILPHIFELPCSIYVH